MRVVAAAVFVFAGLLALVVIGALGGFDLFPRWVAAPFFVAAMLALVAARSASPRTAR